MPLFYELVNDHELVLNMQPEELAGPLLVELCRRKKQNRNETPNLYNFARGFSHASDEVLNAIAEAWSWLQREGCLAPDWSQTSSGFEIVTRRGYELAKSFDGHTPIGGDLLVKNLLHSIIRQVSWPAFVRGEFDTAAFKAVKQVEVSVRTAGGFDETLVGIKLMREAFAPNAGKLTDCSLPIAEQEAMQHLFAGTIGFFKNPGSHRNIAVSQTEAIETMIIAGHLLRIVESRSTI